MQRRHDLRSARPPRTAFDPFNVAPQAADLWLVARLELERDKAKRAAAAEAYQRRRQEVREILLAAGLPRVDALDCLFPRDPRAPVVFRVTPCPNDARDIEAALAALCVAGFAAEIGDEAVEASRQDYATDDAV
jgi:hypothetical protein